MVTCWTFYFRLFAGIIRTASAEFLEQPAASHIPGKFGSAGWIMEPSQPGGMELCPAKARTAGVEFLPAYAQNSTRWNICGELEGARVAEFKQMCKFYFLTDP